MLRNIDRHAQWRERRLNIGDRVRLPYDDLMRPRQGVYRHTFEVVGFGGYSTSWCGPRDGSRPRWRERSSMAHTVFVRRLADGWTAQISGGYVTHYREQWGESAIDESVGHRNLRRLARMRGDVRALEWQRATRERYAAEARFERRRREYLASYRYPTGRITFTTDADLSALGATKPEVAAAVVEKSEAA